MEDNKYDLKLRNEIGKKLNLSFVDTFHDGFALVEKDKKWNYVDVNGNIILTNWFEEKILSRFSNGFAIIHNGENSAFFINTNFVNIFEETYNFAYDFIEDYAKVSKNKQENLIDKNGDLIFKKWFDVIDNKFDENGFVRVVTNTEEDMKCNLINRNGKLISEEWFDYFEFNNYNYENGYYKIKKEDLYNLINKNGKLISEEWFYDIHHFFNGFAIIIKNNKRNLINTNGEIISKEWFNSTSNFCDGFACVEKNNKSNLINTNGEIISKEWFNSIISLENGLAIVRKNDKYNLINTSGKIIFQEWFDEVFHFFNESDLVRVKKDEKYNFINASCNIVSKEWFDYLDFFTEGLAIIINNNKCNFINTNGEVVFQEWFDEVSRFDNDGFAGVKNGNKYNFINKSENLFFKDWLDCEKFIKNKNENEWEPSDKINFSDRFMPFFSNLGDFYLGITKIQKKHNNNEDVFNFINRSGEVILKEWLIDDDNRQWNNFYKDGIFVIGRYDPEKLEKLEERRKEREQEENNGHNICLSYSEDFGKFIKKEYNIILNQKLISEEWFDEISWLNNEADGYENLFRVKKDNKWNFMNKAGEFILKEWFDGFCSYKNYRYMEGRFYNGLACIMIGNDAFYINNKGEKCFCYKE